MPKANKGELIPRKAREFELYTLWKSLPPVFKNSSEDIQAALGLKEEGSVAELISIKNQNEFAAKYGVSINNLTDWNKHLETNPPKFQEYKNIFKKFTKNMLASLYRKGIAKGDAAEIKLWFQLIEDWQEREGIQVVVPLQVNIMEETIDKIYGHTKNKNS